MITVQLDRDIEERLEALGARSDSSKVDMVRERLLDALDAELRDLRQAEERLKKPARRWTQEELEQGEDTFSSRWRGKFVPPTGTTSAKRLWRRDICDRSARHRRRPGRDLSLIRLDSS